MIKINDLSSIIFTSRSSEDAAVLAINYFIKSGVYSIDKLLASDSSAGALYNILLERAEAREPVLRHTLAISIAKDILAGVAPASISKTLLDIMYFTGIDVDPQLFNSSELEYVGNLIELYKDDPNIAAVAVIDFVDQQGGGIEEGGFLENDKDYCLYLTKVNQS